jgi:FkbM family methyltransferase
MSTRRGSHTPGRRNPYISIKTFAAHVRLIWEHPGNRGKRGRALIQAAFGCLWVWVSGAPLVVPIGAHSFVMIRPRLYALGAAKPLYGNPPDPHETAILLAMLRPGDLFVDVGANIGMYTLLATERGARVVAVEASSEAFGHLEANVALNHASKLVECVHAAASRTSGTLELTIGTDTLNHVVTAAEGIETEQIKAIALDDLVGDQEVMAMKIDVEGFEEEVLAGCARLLSDRRIAYLQVENNDSSARHFDRSTTSVWSTLRSYGYQLYELDRHGSVRAVELPELVRSEVIAIGRPDLVAERLPADALGGHVR